MGSGDRTAEIAVEGTVEVDLESPALAAGKTAKAAELIDAFNAGFSLKGEDVAQ